MNKNFVAIYLGFSLLLVLQSFGQNNNDFLSPMHLRVLNKKFKQVAKCFTFSSFSEYKNHYPFYLPYSDDEKKRWNAKPSLAKAIYCMIASTFLGRRAYWIMPSLSTIFLRK